MYNSYNFYPMSFVFCIAKTPEYTKIISETEKVRLWNMMRKLMVRLMDVLNSLRNSDLAAKEDFPMPSNLLASYKYSA